MTAPKEIIDELRQMITCACSMLNRRGTAAEELANDLSEKFGELMDIDVISSTHARSPEHLKTLSEDELSKAGLVRKPETLEERKEKIKDHDFMIGTFHLCGRCHTRVQNGLMCPNCYK
jgi:predicted PP-loop superfamily ATPase